MAATPNVTLSALQGNDTTWNLAVFEADGVTPLNCTGLTPLVVVKGAEQAADITGTTLTLTTGVSWVSQSGGTLLVSMSHTLLGTAGVSWWRLDLVNGSGDVTTAMYGPLVVTAV